jgi:hypothetical protein
MTDIVWDSNDIPAPAKGARIECENPFTWRPRMSNETPRARIRARIICKVCGEPVPAGGMELSLHVSRCRPEAAEAIDDEFDAREAAARAVAAEGHLGIEAA